MSERNDKSMNDNKIPIPVVRAWHSGHPPEQKIPGSNPTKV
jgi:hypothetical protein